jgi:hypothetical protein
MDELIEAIQRQADVSREQARVAVTAMVGYLSAKLPSPLIGRIQSLLDNGQDGYDSAER